MVAPRRAAHKAGARRAVCGGSYPAEPAEGHGRTPAMRYAAVSYRARAGLRRILQWAPQGTLLDTRTSRTTVTAPPVETAERPGKRMDPRIHVITLAVSDLPRALEFYRSGLGLESPGIIGTEFAGDESRPDGAVVMFQPRPRMSSRELVARRAGCRVHPIRVSMLACRRRVRRRRCSPRRVPASSTASTPTSTTPQRTSTAMRQRFCSGSSPDGSSRRCWRGSDGVMTVAVVPVNRRLDLKRLAAARAGKKAVMADAADIAR